MTFYEKVQMLCRDNGFEISKIRDMIPDLKVSTGAISGWKSGAKPRADKIKAIADYFGVSVEYLTGDSSVSVRTVGDNHGIIGHAHAPVTINNAQAPLSEQAAELLDIFNGLSVVNQARLLAYAAELKDKQ